MLGCNLLMLLEMKNQQQCTACDGLLFSRSNKVTAVMTGLRRYWNTHTRANEDSTLTTIDPVPRFGSWLGVWLGSKSLDCVFVWWFICRILSIVPISFIDCASTTFLFCFLGFPTSNFLWVLRFDYELPFNVFPL